MPKKRKSDASRLDEVDRGMYTAFCGAANSLSQLYSQATNQQRISFQTGERHAMEKLYNWILRQQEDGVRVMPADIITYIQAELDIEESPPSQTGVPVSFNTSGLASVGQGQRSNNSDQTKNSVFSNALSSPVRRSLQNYHLSQGGNHARIIENTGSQIRDPNPPSSNDTSMDVHDMHADSPDHDSPY